jgi:hypothetical protein
MDGSKKKNQGPINDRLEDLIEQIRLQSQSLEKLIMEIERKKTKGHDRSYNIKQSE